MRNVTTKTNPNDYPYMKQRNGKPAKVFEKVGPFTLIVTNHGFYETYEVRVTGDVSILKQASRPNLDDIGRALDSADVPYKVKDDYRNKARQMQGR